MEDFAKAWDAKYPTNFKQWRLKWTGIITSFDFPPLIRKTPFYRNTGTTNAIESVNSVIRKFTSNRKMYLNEGSALKLIYMAIHEASKKWTMPIHHWKPALAQFLELRSRKASRRDAEIAENTSENALRSLRLCARHLICCH